MKKITTVGGIGDSRVGRRQIASNRACTRDMTGLFSALPGAAGQAGQNANPEFGFLSAWA